MKKITLKEVEYVAFRLAETYMTFREPIPKFGTRFPNVLESSLATPFQRYAGKDAYKGIIGKAAILLYLMIKNHPFQNGNKRIAITTLLFFLYKNKRWLKVDNQELYNFAIWVAQSPARLRKQVLEGIETFIRTFLVKS